MADLFKGAIGEYLRGKVTTEVVDTYNEIVVSTPASKTEKLAMLIHRIIVQVIDPNIINSASCSTLTHIADRSSDVIKDIDAEGILASLTRTNSCGVVSGTLSEYQYYSPAERIILLFPAPILYTKDTLYFAVDGVANTVHTSARFEILYTLERVTPEQFIAALVE